MRRAYKPLFWRATRPENTADCMNEWKYFLKYNINISIIIRFKQYLRSIIQSIEFTRRVARQNNGLYVLRMIVKLAYSVFLRLVGRIQPRITVRRNAEKPAMRKLQARICCSHLGDRDNNRDGESVWVAYMKAPRMGQWGRIVVLYATFHTVNWSTVCYSKRYVYYIVS